MKNLKLLAALLALAIGLVGCGNGSSTPSSKPENRLDGDNMIASNTQKQEYEEPEDVAYMRLLAGEDEYRACVLYLGGSYEITTDVQQVLDSQTDLRELWGFVYDIPQDHWVVAPDGGCDLYCIFPQDPDSTLFVYETSLTDDAENPLQRGKQLYYSEDGQPILLLCNISDIVPNTEVELYPSTGEELVFSPFLSGENGHVLPAHGCRDRGRPAAPDRQLHHPLSGAERGGGRAVLPRRHPGGALPVQSGVVRHLYRGGRLPLRRYAGGRGHPCPEVLSGGRRELHEPGQYCLLCAAGGHGLTAADPHREECTMKQTKKITILHSNDLHGDFLAEQVDEKLVGGVSMLSGYIEKVRAEQPNTIYVIAGDMFRGSVIDSEYKGLSTIEIMNALAPDVVTIGNHEVDYGIAHLLFIEKCARFPIINANLYIKNTSTRLFTPYKILRMDGMNILFIGIITQDVINQTKSESLVGSFVDTAAAAAEVGKICNAHNSIDIDFTVLLTHIGFEEDRHLARQLDPAWGVDLIIGGHSHTYLEHEVEENGVIIAQAGTGTDQIGRFDIIVDTDNNCIDSYTWRTVPICAETCPRNPAMEQVLQRFTSQVDEKYSHIVGRFRRELTHPQRTRETELGNLFADIFTRSLGIDVMLIGSGSIRAEKLGPIVTYGDLIEGFPYDDGVFMFKVTGQQLRQMLHYMLREEAYTGHTEFYQLPSTLRLRYDRAKGDFDYFTYCGKEVGKEIGDDALFTVGLQNYHFKNIESFFNISYDTICKIQKPRSVATSCQDILMEYFREHEMLDAAVDGRMTILPPAGQ